MSSFWNRLTGGNEEKHAESAATGGESEIVRTAPSMKPAYGIAQANELMSKLPMGENADLVVSVIRSTLESVGVQVRELIAQAKSREGELRTQIDQRRSAIEELERRIEAERQDITRIEGELALTSRTRDGLERCDSNLAPRPLPATAASAVPPALPPIPTAERGPSDSDRPTVMAVAKGLGEVVLRDSDFESIPPVRAEGDSGS